MMRRILSTAICLAVLTVSQAPAQATGGGHRGDWASWQGDTFGTRHNAAERQLTPATVGGLKLRWAFAYPKQAGTPRSQPAVVGDTVYFGSPDGHLYAREAASSSGRAGWTTRSRRS